MARMGRGEVRTGFWRGKPEGKRALADLSINERIILKWEHGMD